MRTLTLALLIVAGSAVNSADGADSPYSAWKRVHNAAKKKNWNSWADSMTPECQRVLVVDLVGLLVSAADEARRSDVGEKKIKQFEREFESAMDEWVSSGTVRNIVRTMAKELGHDNYQPTSVDSCRLAAFGRQWDIPARTAEDRLECRIFIHTLELIAQKRWEQITGGQDLDENFDEAAFENAMNKAASQMESRFKKVIKSVPDLVTLNLMSDLGRMRQEKHKLAEMYGTLAEIIPDVVRLCEILELDCEPILATASGSVSEFTVEEDRATAPLTLRESGPQKQKTLQLQFSRTGGRWKIDSLGYGRWLSARIQPE